MRRRGRKRVTVARVMAPGATEPNEHWAMDFVRDTRADGRFRSLRSLEMRGDAAAMGLQSLSRRAGGIGL